jgi:Cd2+/Zn2+-exporting ATPase
MPEETLKLEIPLLIPGLVDQQDPRISRLEGALRNRKGIQRVHVTLAEDEAGSESRLLCLHYDPSLISIDAVRRIARRAGAQTANRYRHLTIPVEGVDCSDCVVVLEHSLKRLDGVLNARASYTGQKVFLEFDSYVTNRALIENRIVGLGYRVQRQGVRRWYERNHDLLINLGAGLLLFLGWVGGRFLGFPPVVSLGFYLGAYLAGGWDTARHAWQALRLLTFDTDLLMITAALGAAFLGEYAEGALLLFLFGLGHALEGRTLEKARQSIRALAQLTPKTALVRREGKEIEVPVDEIDLEETAIVRPGTRIPVDGIVSQGHSAVDQSPVTGESLPVEKTPGEKVFAGSINGEGVLEVRVTRLSKDSTLARVVKMVELAQAQKPPSQLLTERFMRWFVPVVLVGDLLLIFVPPMFGFPFQASFRRAMMLLVAASPCALALGAPAAVLAGVAQAARNGVLVKGGAHLENLGRLKVIAFDKTGTITRGKPEVTDVVSLDSFDKSEVLALAASVESRSAHPLAQAIVRAAQAEHLALPEARDAAAVTGRGVQAIVGDTPVLIGSAGFLASSGIQVQPAIRDRIASLEAGGKTTILVAYAGHPVGVIAAADVVRPGLQDVITSLHQLGLFKTIMLTGDEEHVAAYIAGKACIGDYRAGLLPEEKVTAIQELIAEDKYVSMVGDGVNDAPVLAQATVGIAMGGAGTDVALETADVALMGDDLSRLPFAVGLGRFTRRLILQNLAIASGAIVFLVFSTLLGWTSLGAAVAIHEGSTVAVALNALRLLNYQPE